MPAVWLVSDTHFGHEAAATKFTRSDGSPMRPFRSVEEMDETMIARWNERVRPQDKVYHLGDVVMNRRCLQTLSRLNGDKILIKGNHDIFRLEDYLKYFREIRAYHVVNGMILSHIPVHASNSSLGRFGSNIHGHLHWQRVMLPQSVDPETGDIVYSDRIDPRYWCACVEHTDYAPVLFEDAVQAIRDQGGHVGFRDSDISSLM